MIRLDDIRDSLEGHVPGLIATCSADGMPNVCFLSQVEYVDAAHVGLTFQFFNKTRRNVQANPYACVTVVDPFTAAAHELSLKYLRTEAQGATFERMKAKLASIASATGTTGIFRLQGADIYRVMGIQRLEGPELPKPQRPSRLTALRACSDLLAGCDSLACLLDRLLDGLARHFGIEHAMVLAIDAQARRFYTLASRGYDASGVGSEIPLGVGAVGIAALGGTPIRLAHAAAEYGYVRAIRERAAADPDLSGRLESAIPFPGLREPASQLAVPIDDGQRVLGVLHVESEQSRRFDFADEEALVVLARQVALVMHGLDARDEPEAGETDESSRRGESGTQSNPGWWSGAAPARKSIRAGDVQGVAAAAVAGAERRRADASARVEDRPLVVRHFARDDSIFLNDEYLIKGVAGAIFWSLMKAWCGQGRESFSNRELRADRSLGLPDLADNLEARLHLLDRRLRERDCGILMERTGRGRFRLSVRPPVRLSDD